MEFNKIFKYAVAMSVVGLLSFSNVRAQKNILKDINGDGYADKISLVDSSSVYSKEYDYRIMAHLNDGKGNFSNPKELMKSNKRLNEFVIDDINSDGQNDLMYSVDSVKKYAAFPGSNLRYVDADYILKSSVNDGKGNFSNPKEILRTSSPIKGFSLENIAGDKNKDLIYTVLGEDYYLHNKILKGDGKGNFK